MKETRQFILSKIECTQGNLSQIRAQIEEHQRQISELNQQEQESNLIMRHLHQWLGEIPPDDSDKPKDEIGDSDLPDEPTIRRLVNEWIASQHDFTGTQLVGAIRQHKPSASAVTIRSELSRLKREGLVQHIGKDAYQTRPEGHGDRDNIRRGNDRMPFRSEGRPHIACILLAMGFLGRPASPEEVFAFLQQHPEINFRTNGLNPVWDIRKIMREDKKRCEIVDKGIWQLSPRGKDEFHRLYIEIADELHKEPGTDLFTSELIQT